MKNFNLFRKNTKYLKYDYSDSLCREDTVNHLIHICSQNKASINSYWKKMRAYYDGNHEIRTHTSIFTNDKDIPWSPAQSPDGYIAVESQLDPSIPDFEFSPRGKDDYEKAKQREEITHYVCDINDLETKNSINERRLAIYGTAIWKVCWDSSSFDGTNHGEVLIDTPKPEQIFTDPSSTTVDGCEYIGYMYRIHKEKAKRIFRNDLETKNIDIESFVDPYRTDSSYFDLTGKDRCSYDNLDETITVTEWWFRQPCDGKQTISMNIDGKKVSVDYSWSAGDIALSILVGGKEVRYIPNYWNNTDCKMFPFVIYCKVPNEDTIWGKSELESIIPLIDAADRELSFAQLNSAFCSNDIIVAEENALCDDSELDNSPGAVWKLRPGMMGKIQRLGNSSYSETYQYNNTEQWRNLIQATTGNFDMYQGREPTRVTTASGIALLNERAKSRQSIKKVIRSEGFKRLFELIDRTTLEYYNDGRVILIGAASKDATVFKFSNFASYPKGSKSAYIPVIDVKIHIGDGVSNSKAFTVQALSDLIRTPITQDNYKLVQSFVDLIGLPMRKEICDMLESKFSQQDLLLETLGKEQFYNDGQQL